MQTTTVSALMMWFRCCAIKRPGALPKNPIPFLGGIAIVLLVAAEGQVSLVNARMPSIWDVKAFHSLNEESAFSRYRGDGNSYPMAKWPIARAFGP
jgi:hypothetical protein